MSTIALGQCFPLGEHLVGDDGSSILKHASHYTDFIQELPKGSGSSCCLLRPWGERKTVARGRNWSKACKGLETQLKHPGQYSLQPSLCLWRAWDQEKPRGTSKLGRSLLWDLAVVSLPLLSLQIPELQAGLVSGRQAVTWMSLL